MAICETRLGHPERATASFQKVVELRPLDWQAWNNLGANLIATNRAERAVRAFQKATGLNPRSESAWFNLGSTLLKLGRAKDAFEALDKAYGLAPRDAEIKAARTEAAGRASAQAEDLIRRRQFSQARTILITVRVALEGSSAWNNLMGYAEFKLNEPRPALAHLQKALELEPDNERFLLDLGELLIHYRANAAARQMFEIGARKMPASPRVQFMLAVSYVLEERRAEAIHLLKEVIRMDADFEPAYKALGECYEETKNGEELVALGEKFLARRPESATGPYLKGLGLLQIGIENRRSLEPAIEALRLAAQKNPNSPEPRFVLARAYQYAELHAQAIPELQEVVRLDPQHDRAHYQLATLYRREGNQQMAEASLKVHQSLKKRERPIVMLVEAWGLRDTR